jgi:hypothetical protein
MESETLLFGGSLASIWKIEMSSELASCTGIETHTVVNETRLDNTRPLLSFTLRKK